MNFQNVQIFAKQLESIQGRIIELYRGASTSVQLPPDVMLPRAYKELGTASEELQVAYEELLQQNEALTSIQAQLEGERQRYQNLFEFMPQACLLTDVNGKIQEVNRAAATLFNMEPSLLVGKLLVSFVPPQERRVLRNKLTQLSQCDRVQDFSLPLQPRNGELFDATLTVGATSDAEGKCITLRWIVHDISDYKRMLKVLSSDGRDLKPDRSLHFYTKGEVIPLQPQTIWLVHKGLVKLSTMSERGEEVVIGIAGPSMPFGSGLTALLTYQATALTKDVQLVTIPLSEITSSGKLCQTLLPQMITRLRQTESLLAISGKRQVKERLYHLLLFLKQEFGQPVDQGTRLSVRLTHQDLADACCTTRVTITRLLGSFQQERLIRFDAEHHLVLLDVQQQKCS